MNRFLANSDQYCEVLVLYLERPATRTVRSQMRLVRGAAASFKSACRL